MAKSCLVVLLLIGLIGATAAGEKPLRMTPVEGQTFNVSSPAGPAMPKGNFIVDFEPAVFPPAGWSLAGTATLWSRSTDCSGYGIGTAAMLADFYNIDTGTQDFISGDIFPASAAGDSIMFDYAYAAYDASYRDSMSLLTSTNGGTSWTPLSGLGLRDTTAPHTTNQFVPTAGQWRTMRYALPVGTNKVDFRAITAYGNEMYIDNIQVTGQLPDHDVLLAAINAPRGQVLAPLNPQVVVKNIGNNTESFLVTMAIDSAGVEVYRDSQNVVSLASSDTLRVDFATWSMGLGNVYNVTAYTALAGDQVMTNDTAKATVNSYNQRRNVFVEDFTAQWCQYCPWVQNSLQQLKSQTGDSLVIVAWHPSSSSDSFYTQHSLDIMNFYGNIGGYPTTVWDGGDQIVGGWSGAAAAHRAEFDLRKTINSPFSVTLNGTQNGNSGTVHAEMYYPGGVPVSGNIKMAVIEESKRCVWPTGQPLQCDSMRDFLRDMFPSSTGDAITINQGTNTKDIAFTLNAAWNKARLLFVVYVNNMTSKEVYNVNEIPYSDLVNGVAGAPAMTPAVRTALLPVSPNPASGPLRLAYDLAAPSRVALNVYDIAGRLVTCVASGNIPAGHHTVAWNGQNCNGQRIASGVYFVRLDAAGTTMTRRVTIIR